MERKIENIDELAAEIAEHSFQKHVLEKGEFISEILGKSICLSGKKEFAEHIKKTLQDGQRLHGRMFSARRRCRETAATAFAAVSLVAPHPAASNILG
jgi:hypothetical protein